jgi:antitoxin component of RelBE/YafQ-DinJ toxin-antitoxin module
MPPLLINSESLTRAIMINSYNMAINRDVMQMAQTVVRAIVEDELKVKAQAELAKQGLTLSDLVRMALREAAEGRISFSFDGVIRNRETLKAMQELDEGKGERVASLNAFHEMMKK